MSASTKAFVIVLMLLALAGSGVAAWTIWRAYEAAGEPPEPQPTASREREPASHEQASTSATDEPAPYTPIPSETADEPADPRAFPLAAEASGDDWHTFTSADEKFVIEARLLGFENGKAQLERRDNGLIVLVEAGKFSKDDREWIRAEIKRRNAAPD